MEATVGIGINIQRKDAFDKVNGFAKYNIDYTSPQALACKNAYQSICACKD